jgi:ribulose 1,5-bisphosphate carboxylase large subunit-like protein
LREAWEAAVTNTPLEAYSATHPALAKALEAYA